MKKWKVGIAGVRGLSTMAGFRCDPQVKVTAFCDWNITEPHSAKK